MGSPIQFFINYKFVCQVLLSFLKKKRNKLKILHFYKKNNCLQNRVTKTGQHLRRIKKNVVFVSQYVFSSRCLFLGNKSKICWPSLHKDISFGNVKRLCLGRKDLLKVLLNQQKAYPGSLLSFFNLLLVPDLIFPKSAKPPL